MAKPVEGFKYTTPGTRREGSLTLGTHARSIGVDLERF